MCKKSGIRKRGSIGLNYYILYLTVFLAILLTPALILADHGHQEVRHMSPSPSHIKKVDYEVDRCYRKQDKMKKPAMEHKEHMDHMSHKSTGKMAHADHTPKHGGTFFMASNNKHHLEGVYSKECGFQLYIYNEYTEPITVMGIQAFIKIIEETDGTEHVRFLSPTKDHLVLQSPLIQGHHSSLNLKDKFSIVLYLKLPGSDIPDLFNFL